MFACDYHTHTKYSFDGAPDSSVDALCRAALARGITDLAVTDHFECNWRAESAYPPYDADAAIREVEEAKERYRGRLQLTLGIELGQADQYPDEAKALLEKYPFEFVIGSVHNLAGAPDFACMDFEKLMTYPSYVGHLFERNLRELSAVVDTLPKLHTLGHLTYMRRYCALAGRDYDFLQHAASLEPLFRKLVKREVALEVNVSTLWKGLGFSMPDRALLSLYRDCGGRLVTLGTDSHSPLHVGECIEEGLSLVRSVGLCHVLVIRNGEREEQRI